MVSYLFNRQHARPTIVTLNKVYSWRESQLNVYGDEEDWPWAEVGGRSVGREPQEGGLWPAYWTDPASGYASASQSPLFN